MQGDTDRIPMGGGHGSSRATYMGGTAIWRASEEIIAKGARIAAEALEAAEADIRFADGSCVVAGTDRSVALLDVAALARGNGTPLDTYHAWTREWMTFPKGAHVVEVEIDPDTGEAGAVGAFPAVTNAILDALAFGVTDLVGPATPEGIWRAVRPQPS